MKKALTLILIVMMLLSLASCQKKEEIQTLTEPKASTTEPAVSEPATQEATTEPVAVEPDPGFSYHDLFNGNRPIAFMINNHAEARPQSGWDKIKVAYEITVEGRLTRYLFVTDSPEGIIGPVRSARPAFFNIVAEYRAIYGHVGNYDFVKESGVEKWITDWDQFYKPGYYRSNDRVAPHNCYADLSKIYAAVKAKGISTDLPEGGLQHWKVYDQEKIYSGGTPALSIFMSYDGHSKIEYRYIPEEKVYHKYIDGKLQTDKESKAVASFSQLIVMPRVQGKMPNGVHEKILYVGTDQAATYYVQGQAFPVTFDKTSDEAPMKFKLNGEELILNPGLLMVNIIPNDIVVTVK